MIFDNSWGERTVLHNDVSLAVSSFLVRDVELDHVFRVGLFSWVVVIDAYVKNSSHRIGIRRKVRKIVLRPVFVNIDCAVGDGIVAITDSEAERLELSRACNIEAKPL